MKKSLLGVIVFSVLPLFAFADPPGFTSLDLVSITGGTPPTTDPILTWDADDLFINFNATSATNVSGLNLTYNFDFTSTSSVVGDTFLLLFLFPDTARPHVDDNSGSGGAGVRTGRLLDGQQHDLGLQHLRRLDAFQWIQRH